MAVPGHWKSTFRSEKQYSTNRLKSSCSPSKSCLLKPCAKKSGTKHLEERFVSRIFGHISVLHFCLKERNTTKNSWPRFRIWIEYVFLRKKRIYYHKDSYARYVREDLWYVLCLAFTRHRVFVSRSEKQYPIIWTKTLGGASYIIWPQTLTKQAQLFVFGENIRVQKRIESMNQAAFSVYQMFLARNQTKNLNNESSFLKKIMVTQTG